MRITNLKTELCVLLLCALVQAAQVTEPNTLSTHAILLTPAPVTERIAPQRIDFDYRFDKALPPFLVEPIPFKKQRLRGLIPTTPPTPFIHLRSDHTLLLDTRKTQDFTHASIVNAPHTRDVYGHYVFNDLSVSTEQNNLSIPYQITLNTYGGVCSGWMFIKTSWQGQIEISGKKWHIGIIDNMDGIIDQNDLLWISDASRVCLGQCQVPSQLYLAGHGYTLEAQFEQGRDSVVLKATLEKIQFPLGRLSVQTEPCQFIQLYSKQLTCMFFAPTDPVNVPIGTYFIRGYQAQIDLNLATRHRFKGCETPVHIKDSETTTLNIGPPLQNKILVTREKDTLKMKYLLTGSAGESYDSIYYSPEQSVINQERPLFHVYKGPVRIATGAAPYG